MSHTERLLRCAQAFRRLTGLDPAPPRTWRPQLEQAWLASLCRRRHKKRQRRCYAGKKKRHTLKTQVFVVRKRKKAGRRKAGQQEKRRLRVAAVSPTARGRVHDKKVYDRTRTIVPPGVARVGDTGYQGTT